MFDTSVHTFNCQRCGHIWLPKYVSNVVEYNPKVCPKCKSPYWNSSKKVCIACAELGRHTHHTFPLTLWIYRDFKGDKQVLRKLTILLCSRCHIAIHIAIEQIVDVYWKEKQNNSSFNYQNVLEEDLIKLSKRISGITKDKFMLLVAEIQLERFNVEKK